VRIQHRAEPTRLACGRKNNEKTLEDLITKIRRGNTRNLTSHKTTKEKKIWIYSEFSTIHTSL
jgi:hypothetical protein